MSGKLCEVFYLACALGARRRAKIRALGVHSRINDTQNWIKKKKRAERERDTLMEKMVALIQSAPFCCAKLNLRPFSAASTPDHARVFAIHCTSFKSSRSASRHLRSATFNSGGGACFFYFAREPIFGTAGCVFIFCVYLWTRARSRCQILCIARFTA